MPIKNFLKIHPADTGRKLNVHVRRLMSVQFTSCVYGAQSSQIYYKLQKVLGKVPRGI